MTHVDDLNVGDFVTIVHDYSMYEEDQPIYAGTPVKIKAVGLPFICVDDGIRIFGVDTRRFEIQKVPKEYAKAFEGLAVIRPEDGKAVKLTFEDVVKKKAREVDPNACPRCGAPRKNRLNQRTSEWELRCDDCDGGPVT